MLTANIMFLIRPAAGGMKEHLISLIKHLDAQKYNIFVAYPADSGMEQALKTLEVQTLPIDLVGELNLFADLKAVRQLVKYLREKQVDILHVHSSKAGLVGRVAALLVGTPVVIMTVHNFIFDLGMSRFRRRVYAITEALLAKLTHRIITVSNALADGIQKYEGVNRNRLVTIYNGIDVGKFPQNSNRIHTLRELGFDPALPTIGTIARLAPQKGITYLLEAAHILQTAGAEIQVIIVGEGPLRSELEAKAHQLGLNSIRFTGYRAEISEILNCMDIFVLPSLSEGFGITILEAMAAGKPVVASAVGGIPEAIVDGETGILVPSADSDALAEAIFQLRNHPQQAELMGIKGRQRVQKMFSLEAMVKATEQVYEHALQKHDLLQLREIEN